MNYRCQMCGCNYTIVVPSNPVEQWNFECIGMIGVCTLQGVDGMNVQFRSVASGNSSLLVSYDAGNGAILLTLDIPSIVNDLPTATVSVRGIGETSTDGEAQSKAALDKFLVPSNLTALGASTTFAGLVELATPPETQAGLSATLAVTPAGLASVLSTLGQMTVWPDAATRAGAAPQFAGQIGTQIDLFLPYVGAGTGVGDFNLGLMVLSSGNNVQTGSTSVDLGALQFAFFNGELVVDGAASFDNGFVRFGNSSPSQVDFASNSTVYIGGAIIPANSVVTTGAVAGELNSKPIAEYLSTDNTQGGYTAFANPATIRTLDTATATPQQIAQCLGTLIADLKSVLLPAT